MPKIVRPMLTVGWSSHGEVDFAAHFEVSSLPYEEMQKLRAMIPVAISELERIWMQHGPPSKMMTQGQASGSD